MSRETVEEYLARGGKVERCRPAGFPKRSQTMRIKAGSDSRGEIYAVKPERQIRRKSQEITMEDIDLSALPEDLLDKLAEIC